MISEVLGKEATAIKENSKGNYSLDKVPVHHLLPSFFFVSNRQQSMSRHTSHSEKRKVKRLSYTSGILKCSIVIATLLSGVSVVAAQARRSTPEPSLPRIGRADDPDPMTSIEEEMRAKRAIKYAEKEYQQNIERAHELSELSSQLGESFKKNHRLDREDLKKLDRLEKLTKAIRSAAGGSDSEKDEDKHSFDFSINVKKMLGVVDSLAERVEKTPRHVISAAVIDEANVLLELIRLVRQQLPKA